MGESSYQCKQRDLKIYDTIELWCPSGSKITAVEKFGLQNVGAKAEDNMCPSDINNVQSRDKVLVNLDEKCDLPGLAKFYPDYYKSLMQ